MALLLQAALSSIDFGHESFPAYQDFLILPLFAIFFPAVRFFLDRLVFEGVGRRLIFNNGQDIEIDERNKKVRKFKESAWKCVYYLSAEMLALAVTYNEPWFTRTSNFWIGPGNQRWPHQKMKLKLKALYMYVGGFYTYSIFALIFWETRRSDFGLSMGHHIASVFLIAMSYMFRFARVGSVVLALHDASDVFLEVGKMSKYSGAEALASFSFILFVLSWVLLRLIYYPFWILWSTRKREKRRGMHGLIKSDPDKHHLDDGSVRSQHCYEVLQTLDKEKEFPEAPVHYYVFNTLLFCLLVLHIYWWVLIYRMLVKQIQDRGKLSDDIRSGELLQPVRFFFHYLQLQSPLISPSVRGVSVIYMCEVPGSNHGQCTSVNGMHALIYLSVMTVGTILKVTTIIKIDRYSTLASLEYIRRFQIVATGD
ncbi:hypothetical protein OSB04_019746 [Centaurea solstitialis]|uniref:TLC domain-containing protein n=1 Tax=Centaurea solstitialis TaxID=347529 RepID=A0AA38SYJ9_9ASTR|nr:hypothetical protein OSB04_019746 [Centaurea solstitialis]